MTINNFSEIIGSEVADNLIGSNLQILYGLAGNDTLSTRESSLPDSISILVGGSGDNTYQVGNNSTSIISENSDTDNDVIRATEISFNQGMSVSLEIENNRHLFIGDLESNQAVVLLDWQTEKNQIESFELADGTFSYQDAVDDFLTFDGYLGSISWSELRQEAELDILPENLDEAIVQVNTKSLVLESGDIVDFYRFRNENFATGTYNFVGEAERDVILANPDLNQTFSLEGVDRDGTVNAAFTASLSSDDELLPFYRLRSLDTPGTYLFVSTEEYDTIFADDSDQKDKWVKEGLDADDNDLAEFYLYGVGANVGVEFHRFQNTQNNTFLFAGPEETAAINSDPDLSLTFFDQGVAFEGFL